jgi:4-amino-4-deoxy-L-arabinose transferase-like glycosyltransferase
MQKIGPTMRLKVECAISVFVTVILLLPFINKAFHVDDPLFLWTAKQILVNPFDFYGFTANWYGTVMPMADIMKNPPISCYFITLAGLLLGWSEVALHGAFLLWAVAFALGTYFLAARLCSKPALAVCMSLVTPVFLVSSTNIMCDTMMLALWVWAIFLWVRGIETKSSRDLLLSAVAIAFCALTKYFGISLFALLPVFTIAHNRKIGKELLFLLIPALVLIGYQVLTSKLYGRGLLFDAMAYSTKNGWTGSSLFLKGLTGLSFTGGCMLTVLFYGPLLWSKRVFSVGAVAAILLFLLLGFMQNNPSFTSGAFDFARWNFLGQFSLMIVTGASVLWLAYNDVRSTRNAGGLLLALWVFGTFFFSVFLNWTINSRSIMPMAPALGILLVRQIARSTKSLVPMKDWKAFLPMLPVAAVSLCLCLADCSLADTARNASESVSKRFARCKKDVWFQGHWGFQYYMEAAGYKAVDRKANRTHPDDFLVIPENNPNVQFTQGENYLLDTVISITPIRWVSVMDENNGSGFYSNKWGPFPFIFGQVDKIDYFVYRVK